MVLREKEEAHNKVDLFENSKTLQGSLKKSKTKMATEQSMTQAIRQAATQSCQSSNNGTKRSRYPVSYDILLAIKSVISIITKKM